MADEGPVPREVFLGDIDEWSGDVRVVRDQTTVEVGKVQEGPHISDLHWCWPVGNPIQLDRVHGELTRFDNHSKVFYLDGGEAAFLELEVEI